MTNNLAWYFTLTVGFALAGCALAQELPSPQQLIVTANDLTDLTSLEPYELTATFVVNPGAPDQKQGRIGILRDNQHYRLELRMDGYGESRLAVGDQLYISRSQSHPPSGILALSRLDRLWRISLPDHAEIGGVSLRQVHDQEAYCFTVKRPKTVEQQFCFDASTKLLFSTTVGKGYSQNTFWGYTAVKSKVVPQQIKWLDGKEVVLEVQNLKVTTVQPAPDMFKVPETNPQLKNLQMQTCDDMKAAEITKRIEPVYPQMAKIAHIIGTVHIYGIIGADGRLHQLEVQSGHPILVQASLEAVKQWEYEPAMCATTPIATETDLRIKFSIY